LYHTIKEIQHHSTGDRHLGLSPYPPTDLWTFYSSPTDLCFLAYRLAVALPFHAAFLFSCFARASSFFFFVRPKRERDEEDEEDAAESVREREKRECAGGRMCLYVVVLARLVRKEGYYIGIARVESSLGHCVKTSLCCC
jgi:hypothetical protein